jgi:beta-lactamase superfamily II metal-dependent hydrolase
MSATEESLEVTCLGIGHGDALLLRWRGRNEQWSCLVDGGENPKLLATLLDEEKVGDLDLLILSHFDNDHVGGLRDISKRRRVRAYWGPALPAYERHLWLFGQGCQEAIARARSLEESLGDAEITYPLEGCTWPPFGDERLRIRVLSPPGRLVRKFLTDNDVTSEFAQYPMRLGWLLRGEAERAGEQSAALDALDAAIARFALTPADIALELRRPTQPNPVVPRDEMAAAWARKSGLEPEFFGDSVLNNTSLVIWLEATTDGRRHRVLLAGDQENWTYLYGRNPMGLEAEVLKASHHGGRVYLEQREAADEMLSFVRPRALLISANGRHNLPRASVRDKAIRWGATVFCTSRRGLEVVQGSSQTAARASRACCCHETLKCSGSQNVKLTLDRDGIRSGSVACHSGVGGEPGPVVRVAQHIIEPSPVVARLYGHELRRHVDWVKRQLATIHSGRVSGPAPAIPGSDPVGESQLALSARKEGRPLLVPYLQDILKEGMNRAEFWARPVDRYGSGWHAYAWPTEIEIRNFLADMKGRQLVVFHNGPGRVRLDESSVFSSLDTEWLAQHADATTRFPKDAFADVFWPEVCRLLENRKQYHCFMHSSGFIFFSPLKSLAALKTFVTGNVRVIYREVKSVYGDESLPEIEFSLHNESILGETPNGFAKRLYEIHYGGLDEDRRAALISLAKRALAKSGSSLFSQLYPRRGKDHQRRYDDPMKFDFALSRAVESEYDRKSYKEQVSLESPIGLEALIAYCNGDPVKVGAEAVKCLRRIW